MMATQISQGSPLAVKKISAGDDLYASGGLRGYAMGGQVGRMKEGHVPNMKDGGKVKKSRFRSAAEKEVDRLYAPKGQTRIGEYASGRERRSRLEEQERKALGYKHGGKVKNYADGGEVKKKVNPRQMDASSAGLRRKTAEQWRSAGETVSKAARSVGTKIRKGFDRAVLTHDRLQAKARARRKRIQAERAMERRMQSSGTGSPVKLKMDKSIRTPEERKAEKRSAAMQRVSRGT